MTPINPHTIRRIKLDTKRETEIEISNRQAAEKFAVEQVGMRIMLHLATKPFSEWPDFAKIAFEYASRDFPMIARFYRENLP